MSPARRTLLSAFGSAGAAALAGCNARFGDSSPSHEYALDVDRIDQSIVEFALYTPDDDPVFGQPAREALDEILPTGSYTTVGYEPLPEDAYVVHDGTYYVTQVVVTGREESTRRAVELTPVEEDQTDETADAVQVESLPQADARVLKILHSYEWTDGQGSAADLVDDGRYVLRRPAEVNGRIATDLDGQLVAMDEIATYRVDVVEVTLTEPAYTARAIELATSRDAFAEIAKATRVDCHLDPSDLSAGARDLFEQAVERNVYRETEPLSGAFTALLDALDLETVEAGKTGQVLRYGGDLYRYGLYVRVEDD